MYYIPFGVCVLFSPRLSVVIGDLASDVMPRQRARDAVQRARDAVQRSIPPIIVHGRFVVCVAIICTRDQCETFSQRRYFYQCICICKHWCISVVHTYMYTSCYPRTNKLYFISSVYTFICQYSLHVHIDIILSV